MPLSSLPRHPREDAKPGTNKYKDIVCSGRIWLQHKASCYRGHDYSNRLYSLQGCTSVIPHARISRVAYTMLGNTPPRLSDTTKSILRAQQRGHLSFVLLRGAWLAGEADPPPTTRVGSPIPAQAAILLTSEEPSNEATTQRAHTVIPHGGSAYKPMATQVIRRIH